MTTANPAYFPDNGINDLKIRMRSDQPIRWRNAAGSADLQAMKFNSSDLLYFINQPKYGSDPSADDDLARKLWIDNQLALYVPLTQRGANNGIATLDGSGRIPSSQLPNSAMEYKGVWDASSNTPTLANGTGNAGDQYRVNVAGTQDLGSGSVSYDVGDIISYTGSVWEIWSASGGAVDSVNGQTGVVVLDTDDISEGSTNLYWTSSRFNTAFSGKTTADLAESGNLYYTAARFNSAFSGKTTSDLAESGNLYFTDTRARSAQRYKQEVLTLNGTNITNQNVSLAQTPIAESEVVVAGGFVQRRTTDYSISGTTLSFAGDIAAYAASGDVLIVSYNY